MQHVLIQGLVFCFFRSHIKIMFDSIAPLDILLLAVIAGVVLYRLYKTLGTQTEVDPDTKVKEYSPPPPESAEQESSNVQPLFSPDDHTEEDDEQESPYAEILDLDPDFDDKAFLEGASIAYDMIVTALANSDTKTLKSLLSTELFDDFCADIKEAKKLKHKTELEIIGINDMEITSIAIEDTEITLEVTIDSEQMVAVYDQDNNLIEGSAEELTDVRDIWSFQRDTESQNPNWTLVHVRYEE